MQVLLFNSQFFHQKYGGVTVDTLHALTNELIKKKIDIKSYFSNL